MTRPNLIDEPAEQQSFSWPPRALSDHVVPSDETGPRDAPAATPKWRRSLRELERFWLSPIAEPLAIRIESQTVLLDAAGAYCDRCGGSIGPYEADEFGCAGCRNESLPWQRAVRLGEYAHGLGQSILDLKFRGQRKLALDLGRRLGLAALEAGIPREDLAIVPVAMAWTRRFTRPFDHAHEIALGVARELEAPVVAAFRRRHRPSQRSVPASRRAENVRGSFIPLRGVNFTGWTVFLVDDVRTTGATLAEASRTLRKEGAKDIWVGVLGVASSRDRRGVEA